MEADGREAVIWGSPIECASQDLQFGTVSSLTIHSDGKSYCPTDYSETGEPPSSFKLLCTNNVQNSWVTLWRVKNFCFFLWFSNYLAFPNFCLSFFSWFSKWHASFVCHLLKYSSAYYPLVLENRFATFVLLVSFLLWQLKPPLNAYWNGQMSPPRLLLNLKLGGMSSTSQKDGDIFNNPCLVIDALV